MRPTAAGERDAASLAWPAGPLRPVALAAELHVWRVDLEAAGRRGAEQLPAVERERAERKRRPGAGARWAAARWALRLVLGRYLDEEPAAIELTTGERGKPRLAAEPERLAFNLSHSDALALIAVTAGREVGVDVERIDPGRNLVGVAKRELGPPEAAAVARAPDAERAAVFYAAWTRHEARLKCLGVGLGVPRAEPHAVAVSTLDPGPGPGYAAAVAVTRGPAFACRHWSLP